MKVILLILFSLLSLSTIGQVSIIEGTDENQEVFIIKTKAATYYYQKEAGGFSSIVDKNGNDWINFTTTPKDTYPASAASTYRGLPNLVHGGKESGTGHPGFKNCTSAILDHNTLISTSNSGNWEWEWKFYDHSAKLTITKVDPIRPYWFLYEGTIGGDFTPTSDLWGNNVDGLRRDNPDFYKTEGTFAPWHTLFFGQENQKLTFYVYHIENDQADDVFGFLGSTDQGNDSPDGMVVFGFGRGKKTSPLLTGKNSFIIGFCNRKITKKNVLKKINKQINQVKEQ